MAPFLQAAIALLSFSTLGLGFHLGPKADLPKCSSSTSGGFKHPGIYHDCNSLDRLQSNIATKQAPFVSALNSAVSRSFAMNASIWNMEGPFESVIWAGADGHNIPLQHDGKAVYKLTLGWYATGNSTWLARAKSTILAWGQTLSLLDEQIQGGEGLSYMTAAAEILRATSKSSGWTAADTATYNGMIARIIAPWSEKKSLTRNNFFMNQGVYGNSGAMAVAVFSENRTMYDDMVYHATVGANPDPTIDYAIPIQISGEKEFYGQVTEMGRDEAHPMGTLRGLSYMGLTSRIQRGTDFFGAYGKRLAAGFEYWSRYNSGDDTLLWEPKVIRPGSGEVYWAINATSRGRNYATYYEPLEAIGVGYHEYFKRGQVLDIPHYTDYMKWQGIGWDDFEFGTVGSVAHLGFE